MCFVGFGYLACFIGFWMELLVLVDFAFLRFGIFALSCGVLCCEYVVFDVTFVLSVFIGLLGLNVGVGCWAYAACVFCWLRCFRLVVLCLLLFLGFIRSRFASLVVLGCLCVSCLWVLRWCVLFVLTCGVFWLLLCDCCLLWWLFWVVVLVLDVDLGWFVKVFVCLLLGCYFGCLFCRDLFILIICC